MRLPRSSLAGLDRDYGGLTPMIDVVFNLLVFFVVAAGSFAADKMLATKLSSTAGTAATSAVATRPVWAVTVELQLRREPTGETVVDMNGTSYANRQRLKSQLRALAEVGTESPINLSIAKDVPLGEMIDVYDACRAAGFVTINFVTQTK